MITANLLQHFILIFSRIFHYTRILQVNIYPNTSLRDMTNIGSINTVVGKKALLLGSGELGKEVAIELQRFGIYVVACDRYADAPAMQIAHSSHVFNMLDANALRKVIEDERPDYIIPEVEAIATSELVRLESEGYNVTPTAKATALTMNREGIRRRRPWLAHISLSICRNPRGI